MKNKLFPLQRAVLALAFSGALFTSGLALAGASIAPAWVTLFDGENCPGGECPLTASVNVGGAYINPTNPITFAGGLLPGSGGTVTPESPTSVGAIDLHFTYDSPNAGGSVPAVFDFNIFGQVGSAEQNVLSDTLQIIITGLSSLQQPGNVGPLVVGPLIVDIHFKSDDEDLAALTPLTGGNLVEQLNEGSSGIPYDQIAFAFATAAAANLGPDAGVIPFLNVRFDSTAITVPEPATLALVCLGLAGLGFSRRKR